MIDRGNENLPELLVMLIQNVKDDPFEMLMNVCNPVIFSLTNKYFFDGYEKDDLLQEARQVLVKAADEFDIKAGMPFLQYYHMTLLNHFNRLVRKQHAHKRRVNMNASSLDALVEEAGPHVQGISSNTTQPEEAAIAKEIFHTFLLELSPFEEEVFLLFLDGHPQEKIVEKLDSTLDRVKNALYRCSAKLREAIR